MITNLVGKIGILTISRKDAKNAEKNFNSFYLSGLCRQLHYPYNFSIS